MRPGYLIDNEQDKTTGEYSIMFKQEKKRSWAEVRIEN
jgi:hypothetical protein